MKTSVTLRIPRIREYYPILKLCEEQHVYDERVWNIKHGLVHHSFAAGPAAR
jgi:hypothetical protein